MRVEQLEPVTIHTNGNATVTMHPALGAGPAGPSGDSLNIGAPVANEAALPGTGTDGEGHMAEDTGHLWVWDGDDEVWVDTGQWQGPPGSGDVDTIVAGTNITVDATDPQNPIVSATGGGSEPGVFRPEDHGGFAGAAAAAEAYGPRSVVKLGNDVYDITGSFSMSGKSFMIQGIGAGMHGVDSAGSVLRAVSQTGPVLDFDGYEWPENFVGRVIFSGFMVQGDGTANPAFTGMSNSNTSGNEILSAAFRDITVRNTGGPGISFWRMYLSEMTSIIVECPIDPQGDSVPYYEFLACNGNTFTQLGARNISGTTNDCWSGGAFRVIDDGAEQAVSNYFKDCWAEFLHVPTNGTLFHLAGNANVIDNFGLWDISGEAAATGNSYLRLASAAVADFGGNEVRGYIPGVEAGTNMQWGVDVGQDGNRIVGVKGYQGSNVHLQAGVGHTFAELGGRLSTATTAAFDDDSGETTNLLVDLTTGTDGLMPPRLALHAIVNEVTDADDATESGVYYWNDATDAGMDYAHLDVKAYSDVWVRQIAYSQTGLIKAERYKTGGGWSAWFRMPDANMPNWVTDVQVADADAVAETGLVFWTSAGPVGMATAYLFTVTLDASNATQTAWAAAAGDGNETWRRTKDSGVWSTWTRLLDATDIGVTVQAYDADLTTWGGKTAPSGTVVGTSDSQALTNKDLTGGGNTFPTFNQNTTGSAATLTTSRTIGTLTGDVTTAGSAFNGSAANTNATVLATVNSNVGSFGSATQVPTFTVNAKGLTTAASNTTIQLASSAAVTGLDAALALKAPLASPTFTGTPVLPNAIIDEESVAASGTSGTVTLDLATSRIFTLSPSGNVTTLTISNVPASGRAVTVTMLVTQGGTPRTIATPTGGIFMGAATPTQVASKACAFTYVTVDGGTVWYCSAAVQV